MNPRCPRFFLSRQQGASPLVLLCLLIVTSEARAQDGANDVCGADPFESGVAAFDADDFERAVTCFHRALRQTGNPAIRYNIATCFDQLGRVVETRNQLMLYLRETPTELIPPERRSRIQARLLRIDEQLALLDFEPSPEDSRVFVNGVEVPSGSGAPWAITPGEHQVRFSSDCHRPREIRVYCGEGRRCSVVGALEPRGGEISVLSLPQRAVLFIDGERREVSEREGVRVSAGEHRVEVRLEGHEPYEERVQVACGETRRVEIALEPVEQAAGREAVSEGETAGSTGAEPRERRRLPVAWFASGVGLVAALSLAGVVTGALVYQRGDTFQRMLDQCQDGDVVACREGREVADEGEALGRASTGLFIAAGIMAAAALVLGLFTDWHRGTSDASAGVSVAIGARRLGIEIAF